MWKINTRLAGGVTLKIWVGLKFNVWKILCPKSISPLKEKLSPKNNWGPRKILMRKIFECKQILGLHNILDHKIIMGLKILS